MDALVPVMKRHPGTAVLLFSLIFRGIRRLLYRLPVPEVVKQDAHRLWRWRNLSLSLVHSVLTGTWALTCVAVEPAALSDLHKYHTPLSYVLVCVSTGYFVQDAGDIILTGNTLAAWEFMIHHFMVIMSFSYSLYTELYVAGALVALFVEVNSVTLHLRLLLKLANAHSSRMFYINKHLNIFTYTLFRLCTQAYLTWYIVTNYYKLDSRQFFLFAMIVMNIMILVYFYRLIRADFMPQSRKKSVEQNGIHNNNSKKFPCD